MTDAPFPLAPAALPLFHTNIVAVSPRRHANLRLNRDAGFGFTAGVASLPVGIAEFEAAAGCYPILFTTATPAAPIVLLGFRSGWNLFVDGTGTWMPRAYVPAIARAFPFVMIDDTDGSFRRVGFEADAACISPTTGAPLFENGQQTAVVRDAIAFCEAVEGDLAAAAAFGAALESAGLLQPGEATIEPQGAPSVRIGGYRIVDAARLAAIPDEVFLAWRRNGWLSPLYAHLFSAVNWVAFTELALAQLAARQ